MNYLLLALLLIVSELAAAGVRTYSCTSSDSIGFLNRGHGYQQADFAALGFELRLYDLLDGSTKLSLSGGRAAFRRLGGFSCKAPSDRAHWICFNEVGHMFNFNEQTAQFVWAIGYGYAFDDGDSVTLAIGSCTFERR